MNKRLRSVGLALLFGLIVPAFVMLLNSPQPMQAHTAELWSPLTSSPAVGTQQTFTPTWATERVEADKTFGTMTDRSLALDNAHHPHIAYGTDHLYYAWYDGNQWLKETVDPAWGTGWYASIALDHNQHPHISYRDDTNADLRYAYFDGVRWHIEVVDSNGDVGGSTSIALDGNNRPHISYYDSTNAKLKYAYFDGRAWRLETVDTKGAGSSIAVDSSGRPHISYYRKWFASGWKYEIGYAYKNNNTWILQTVITASVDSTSIALDSADRPHIGYHDGGQGKLMYAYWSGSAWVTETVESNISWGSAFVSIALDTSNEPRIAFRNSVSQQLRYASRLSGTWSLETFDNGGGYLSLAVDSGDKPVISYYANGALQLAKKSGGIWSSETVDRSSSFGAYVSLALAPTAPYTPYMSYAGGDGLRYATYQNSAWQLSTVEDSGVAGTSLALAATAPYTPHIAYYASDGKVNYASWTGSVWLTETIDSAGDAGWGISLALAPTAPYTPHVAYIGDGGNLKHAYWTGGGWSIETVDYRTDSFWKLESPSIALAPLAPHLPHISYHSTDTGDLLYAHRAGGGWITETVGFTGNTCEPTSLALDSSSNPHIAYFEWGTLKYVHWTGAAWVRETLDGNASSCDGASLALDTNNHPHIGYAGVRSLRYARYENGSWITATVDGQGDVGRYASLALDRDIRPRIAYHDYTNGDLKFAWQTRVDAISTSGGTFGAFGSATFQFPAGAVTDTVLMSYTVLQPFGNVPNVGVFFDLSAAYANTGQRAQIAPGQTYTVVVHYDEASVPATADEADLALYFWSNAQWIREPTSVVDTVNNTITATPNHLSVWATLFKLRFIYLPIVLRNH